MNIQFKAKLSEGCDPRTGKMYKLARVPEIKRTHCDMAAFRKSRAYGGFANSDLFPGMLKGIRRKIFGEAGVWRSDRNYPEVTVDDTGFLAVFTVVLEDGKRY